MGRRAGHDKRYWEEAACGGEPLFDGVLDVQAHRALAEKTFQACSFLAAPGFFVDACGAMVNAARGGFLEGSIVLGTRGLQQGGEEQEAGKAAEAGSHLIGAAGSRALADVFQAT